MMKAERKAVRKMDNYITNCIHHQVCRGAYNCQTRCQYFEERSQGEWEKGFIDALDKAFSKFDANFTYSGDRVLQILEKLKEEKELATNLQQRPQGEWIFRNGVTCGGYYKCSKCGEVERAEKNFCSNCGASMVKGGTE